MILLLLAACLPQPGEILLSGQVQTAQDAEQGAPGITVSAFDSELAPYSETVTDEEGLFAVPVQTNRVYHLAFSGEAVATTAFSGIVGASDTAIAEDELFVRSDAEVEAMRLEYANCAASELEGGIVEGIVYFRLQNSRDDNYLVAEEAMVEVYDSNGTQYETCYLDTAGESLEAGSDVGATGRFAAFGVPAGPTTVTFRQEIGAGVIENFGYVLMPENGVAPFHPAFIDIAG